MGTPKGWPLGAVTRNWEAGRVSRGPRRLRAQQLWAKDRQEMGCGLRAVSPTTSHLPSGEASALQVGLVPGLQLPTLGVTLVTS